MADCSKKGRGRGARGEHHRSAKLTADQVRLIRELVAAGRMQKDIAADFGVRPNTVSQIVGRQNWRHI